MRVIGYKYVEISRRGILSSPHYDFVWQRGLNDAKAKPHAYSKVGINAYNSAHWAAAFKRLKMYAYLGLAGTGRVSFFWMGWRAEKAEVMALYIPKHVLESLPFGVDEKVRAFYDIPVVTSVRELKAKTKPWGEKPSTFVGRGKLSRQHVGALEHDPDTLYNLGKYGVSLQEITQAINR